MDQKPQKKPDIHIRWMIRRDMPTVLAIEDASYEFPWCEEEFIRCLRQRNCIGMIAEVEDKVVGFMIYELHKNRLHLLNFAVDPDARRHGIGSAMMEKLAGKLSHERRNRIMLEVRETNLEAQLFFKNSGLKAISVLRDFYEDTVEDAYLMQYRHNPIATEQATEALQRITGTPWSRRCSRCSDVIQSPLVKNGQEFISKIYDQTRLAPKHIRLVSTNELEIDQLIYYIDYKIPSGDAITRVREAIYEVMGNRKLYISPLSDSAQKVQELFANEPDPFASFMQKVKETYTNCFVEYNIKNKITTDASYARELANQHWPLSEFKPKYPGSQNMESLEIVLNPLVLNTLLSTKGSHAANVETRRSNQPRNRFG